MTLALIGRSFPPPLVWGMLGGWAVVAGVVVAPLALPSRRTRPRRLAALAVLVGGSVGWLWVNRPVEGSLLVEVTDRLGLAAADLVVLPPLALALVIAVGARRTADDPVDRRG